MYIYIYILYVYTILYQYNPRPKWGIHAQKPEPLKTYGWKTSFLLSFLASSQGLSSNRQIELSFFMPRSRHGGMDPSSWNIGVFFDKDVDLCWIGFRILE